MSIPASKLQLVVNKAAQDEALKFIDQHKDAPFFLYLSHFAVHDPIQGRGDLVEKYRRKLTQRKAPAGPNVMRIKKLLRD